MAKLKQGSVIKTSNGDKIVVYEGSDYLVDVSDDDSLIVDSPTDLNFSANVGVVDDGDGTVTVNAVDTTDHDQLTNVQSDQHHAQDHAGRHSSGGADEISHNNLALNSDDHHVRPSAGDGITDTSNNFNVSWGDDEEETFGVLPDFSIYYDSADDELKIEDVENSTVKASFDKQGDVDIPNGDLLVGGTTVYNLSQGWVPLSVLQEDAVSVAGNTVQLGGSTQIVHSDLSSISSADHHTRFGNDSTDNVTDIPNRDVEDLQSQGAEETVPVSQGDGSVQMQEVSGELERIADLDGLVSYKRSFDSIRNRRDWIDYIFQENEDMADEITNNQVLNHYVFESQNDAYDRFIDPNHSLGLFAYNNDSEPVLSSVYEAAMFLAPTSFLEGMMTIESVADQISSSEVLMDAVQDGDSIMKNNFGYEEGTA